MGSSAGSGEHGPAKGVRARTDGRGRGIAASWTRAPAAGEPTLDSHLQRTCKLRAWVLGHTGGSSRPLLSRWGGKAHSSPQPEC